MPFIDLFSKRSDLYASARPTYPEALFDFVALSVPAAGRVWDCATGSGQAAVGLARRFREVQATDASAAQIANATPHASVHYSVQPAERTNFAPASFDAVCVAQALHWFDFARFFPEVSRVLKVGGIFVAWGYDWFTLDPAFDKEFQRSVLDLFESHWAPQNALLWNGYRDVPLPFEPVSAPDVPMRVDWTFLQLLAYVHTWSATRQVLKESGREFFDQAEARLRPLWGDPASVRTLSFRLHVIAGRRTGDRMAAHASRD